MLIQYVKDKNGQRTGVVVAVDRDMVGWSKCNIKKDKFNQDLAFVKAIGRARGISVPKPPVSVEPIFLKMVDRAQRYYKSIKMEAFVY
jgi:hypothetical protein